MQNSTQKRREITLGALAVIYALILFFTLSNSLFGTMLQDHDRWTFGYMFTNQSNILVWMWLLLFGISAFWQSAPFYKFVRNRTVITAVTVYISITFFIVAAVLEPFYRGQFNPLNSLFHHFASAIVMWLYFFFVPGFGAVRYRNAWFILIYPLIFLGANLIVGSTVKYANGNAAYAYNFINPNGYPNIFVFLLVMVMLVGIFGAFGVLLIKLKRWLVKNYYDSAE